MGLDPGILQMVVYIFFFFVILKILSVAKKSVKEGFSAADHLDAFYVTGGESTPAFTIGDPNGVITGPYYGWYGSGDACGVGTRISNLCNGKSTCIVPGINNTFCQGDPWPGHAKGWEMFYNVNCNPGYYVVGNRIVSHTEGWSFGGCALCPAGKACAGGKWVNQSTSGVSSCYAGTYSLAGASTCTPCPAGKYNTTNLATSCISCSAGTYNASSGAGSASACISCSAGTFSGEGASTCQTCVAGTYSAEKALVCEKCPAGTYNPNQGGTSVGVCRSCPAGRYSTTQGAASCESCPPGKYSTTVGATSDNACTFCPAGTYSVGGKGECDRCPTGTASTTVGATSSSTCISCPPGYFSSTTGATICSPVQAGGYSAAGQANPTSVDAGFYSLDVATEQIQCPAGYSCQSRSSLPVLCLAGSYSAAGQTDCTSCGTNKYSIRGATSISGCITLKPGQYLVPSLNEGFRCNSGYVKDVPNSRCVPCEPGYYSNKDVSADATTCTSCPSNTHSRSIAATCTPLTDGQERWDYLPENFRCRSGFYKILGYDVYTSRCGKCPVGTYSNQAAIASQDPTQCTNCEIGFSSPAGALKCDGCAAGTHYVLGRGCVENDLGYYSGPGELRQYKCPPGTYCPRLTASPIPCPKGYYGETSGLSSPACTGICPNGSYCGGSATDTGYSQPITCDLDATI